LIGLSDWQVAFITAAHVGMWVFDVSGMMNSFWGTNRTLKMVFFHFVLRISTLTSRVACQGI